MSGGKKKGIKAYKLYLGAHFVVCQAPVDCVKRIKVDGENAYSEQIDSSQLVKIDKENLFGGEKSEGGVVGDVDLCFGEPTQEPNDYLQSQQEAVPAYRGVLSAILRQVYIGLNPYLKPWSFLVQRIHTAELGKPQWYDEKAEILSWSYLFEVEDIWYHKTVTNSGGGILGNPHEYTTKDYDHSGWEKTRGAIGTDPVMGGLKIGTIIPRSNDYTSNWMRKSFEIDNSDIGDLVVLVYHDDIAAIWWNGERMKLDETKFPARAIIPSNLIKKNNTIALNVSPRFAGDSKHRFAGLAIAKDESFSDMNPAHIVRECLTTQSWGMGVTDDLIDNDSFKKCADVLYDEGFGLSLKYSNTGEIKDFIQEILTAVDAVLYLNRKTGKYVMKLIRDDYDVDSLPVLDETHIVSVSDFLRPQLDELVNYITANCKNPYTGKNMSISVQNPALIQQQLAIISKTVNYSGISNTRNLLRVAERDLRALSYPFISCSIKCDRFVAELLSVGECFVFNYPRYGVSNVVMRVSEISWGTATDTTVTIKCAEDAFSTDEPIYEQPAALTTHKSVTPVVSHRLVTTAPYYAVAMQLGDEKAQKLGEQDAYILAAGGRPASNAVNASLLLDEGAGFADVGNLDFCPCGATQNALDYLDTSLEIKGLDSDEIAVGDLLQLGKGDDVEIVRVDAIDGNTLTIARGCLDTVPHKHEIGTTYWAWQDLHGSDNELHLAGEEVKAKMQALIIGRQTDAELPIDTAELSNRAYLPYPPANVKINGEYYLAEAEVDANTPLSITWSSRNRIQQTAGLIEWTAGNVTSEEGVTYAAKLIDDTGAVVSEKLDIDALEKELVVVDGDTGEYTLELVSVRDSYESYQKYVHKIKLITDPEPYDERIVEIKNPNASNGTSHWVNEIGRLTYNSNIGGRKCFMAGRGYAETLAYQRVDIGRQHAAFKKVATLTWKQASWSGVDKGTMGLRCFDKDGNVLATVFDELRPSPGNKKWETRVFETQLDEKTYYLEVLMHGKRVAGNDNDAYFDDISLKIKEIV